MTDGLDTLVREHRHEIDRIKGSRFLATVAPASTADEAEAFVARIREEFANATHNCWAYRVGPRGDAFRFSDDGEPGGTAGRPILAQIEGHGLTNTAVVVTRWFGGTKLGTGGLVRAYGGATGQALDRAARMRLVVMQRLRVEHPYECSGAVTGLLAAWRLEPIEADYGSVVRLVLEIPEERGAEFTRELTDRTAGRAEIAPVDEPA